MRVLAETATSWPDAVAISAIALAGGLVGFAFFWHR